MGDARVRVGAVYQRQVQHPRDAMVVHVIAMALDEALIFFALH